VRSEQVRVGDILVVHDGEVLPADCLLLSTPTISGECYIETRSLDGETNLKPKLAIKHVNEFFSGRSTEDIGTLHVQCPPPNANLYQFSAIVTWDQGKYEADLKQFLPRGSHLRNSNKVLALVLFTSVDCKLVMNEGPYTFKQSQLDRNINFLYAINITQMFTIAVIMTWMCHSFLI
jgi:phospholipid-translocating ATPase